MANEIFDYYGVCNSSIVNELNMEVALSAHRIIRKGYGWRSRWIVDRKCGSSCFVGVKILKITGQYSVDRMTTWSSYCCYRSLDLCMDHGWQHVIVAIARLCALVAARLQHWQLASLRCSAVVDSTKCSPKNDNQPQTAHWSSVWILNNYNNTVLMYHNMSI
jgi:hypothetical protein